MYDTGYESYRQSEIDVKASTASPAQLVLMLLDGLMDELARAEGHMLAKNYYRKGESVKKCMRILGGLDASLNQDQSSELVSNLHKLYGYSKRQLFRANVRNDVDGFRQVARLMGDIREGWQGFATRVG